LQIIDQSLVVAAEFVGSFGLAATDKTKDIVRSARDSIPWDHTKADLGARQIDEHADGPTSRSNGVDGLEQSIDIFDAPMGRVQPKHVRSRLNQLLQLFGVGTSWANRCDDFRPGSTIIFFRQ
jgi:hypothetical protein